MIRKALLARGHGTVTLCLEQAKPYFRGGLEPLLLLVTSPLSRILKSMSRNLLATVTKPTPLVMILDNRSRSRYNT